MRLIFDMALKPILRGLQHVLLCAGMIVPKINCCGFLIFAPTMAIVVNSRFSIGFKSLGVNRIIGLHTYI